MDIYADESRFKTEIKSDQSPLTEADKLSNEIIVQSLNQLYPDIPIISEESKQIDYAERSKYQSYFLVDPLDGTKEFIKRNGEFTINIAYLEGNALVGGFVYIPVTATGYYAMKGSGAFKIGSDNSIREIKSIPFFLQDPGIKVVASRSHRDESTEKIISSLNQPEIISSGSSLKFLLIAEGSAHFYPRLAPTMEWDTAAAQCILEEAGGSVIMADNLQPVVYNKEDLINPHFIAMGRLLDPETLRNLMM